MLEATGAVRTDHNQIGGKGPGVMENLLRGQSAVEQHIDIGRARRAEKTNDLLARFLDLIVGQQQRWPIANYGEIAGGNDDRVADVKGRHRRLVPARQKDGVTDGVARRVRQVHRTEDSVDVAHGTSGAGNSGSAPNQPIDLQDASPALMPPIGG